MSASETTKWAAASNRLARGGGILRELALGDAQGQRQRDEALLRAVVQVALEPPPLGLR